MKRTKKYNRESLLVRRIKISERFDLSFSF
jgi:hypothetical protein